MGRHMRQVPAPLRLSPRTWDARVSVFILKSFGTFSLPDVKHYVAKLIETDPV